MSEETALALFAAMGDEQQEAVMRVFAGIAGAFADVRDAFISAVIDEALAVEARMLIEQEMEGCA